MNWYRKAIRFSEPSPDWFGKGAIFGYTEISRLKSESIYLPPKIAATWNQKNGITHIEVFGRINEEEVGVYTWIYDIGKKEFDAHGLEKMPPEVRNAAMAEIQTKLGTIKQEEVA